MGGIAWELGVLAGLRDGGVDVTDADVVVGTSAGAAAGAQALSGVDLDELVARQEASGGSERAVPFSSERLTAQIAEAMEGAADPQEGRARIGALALAADTPPEPERRAIIASRLPSAEWPERRFLVPAVDARTGEAVVLDRDSGVGLVDAVAASCAVPGVWPPVTVGDRRLIDGGVRSMTNADLAAGHERVLVLAAMPAAETALPDEVAGLESDGAQVLVIAPDEASVAALGDNPLDPATRAPAARAGRAQGAAAADAVRRLWGD